MIGIVATLKVKDGSQKDFEAAMATLVAAVRANEPGNIQYSLTRKQGSTTEYVVMEQYKSQADVDAHGKSEHFRAAGPALGACLAGPPDLLRLDVII